MSKVQHSKRKLPALFHTMPKVGKLVLHEYSIGLTKHARLRAKVLVFRNALAMHRFWNTVLCRSDLRTSAGAVSSIGRTAERWDKSTQSWIPTSTMLVDHRYYCVIGLREDRLQPEILAHEAVHAAFCYERRVGRNVWGFAAKDCDEERIAYPAGKITQQLMHIANAINEGKKP